MREIRTARIAGFGPLYSGALATALAAVFRLLILRDWNKKMAYPALMVAGAVVSVVFFLSFRKTGGLDIVPQFGWFLPLLRLWQFRAKTALQEFLAGWFL